MNARLQSKLLRAVPPAPKVERIPRQPVALTRIPWGKRDAALGRALCQHIVDATPPTCIPFFPGFAPKLRLFLAQHRVQPDPFPRPAVATDSPSPNGAAAAGNLSTTRSNP